MITVRMEWVGDELMLGGKNGWTLAHIEDNSGYCASPRKYRYIIWSGDAETYGAWMTSRERVRKRADEQVRARLRLAGVVLE